MDVQMDEHNQTDEKVPVHVEVALKQDSTASQAQIREAVFSLLEARTTVYTPGLCDFSRDPFLSKHVERIYIGEPVRGNTDPELSQEKAVPFWRGELHVLVYQLNHEGVAAEEIEDEAEAMNACSSWMLPAVELEGLWETLVFDSHIKHRLLNYATTALEFSASHVDKNIISWNRIALLHGPPGTGKTSLARALAHKLSIHLNDRFPNSQLLEINAHSLFSKWFSESGKLVQKLFSHIQELVEDDESLVCVLIDEVESLTAARQAAIQGSEPSDAVRVVNALLTQMDALRMRDNVLIITTSNLTEAIDDAFVDRADIKQYIGLPSHQGRYDILRTCIIELLHRGLVYDENYVTDSPFALFPSYPEVQQRWEVFKQQRNSTDTLADQNKGTHASASPSANSTPSTSASDTTSDVPLAAIWLCAIAEEAKGLSGRGLRKLPFQAFAFYVKRHRCSLEYYLQKLLTAVKGENSHREDLMTKKKTGGVEAVS